VSILKMANLQDKIFVIFEFWNKVAYMNTQYMIMEKNGTARGPFKIDVKFRMHRSDDIYYDERSSSIVLYAGEKGNLLNRYEIRLNL
jgi:hypothetical protein